jgi:hypothetical protein
MNAALVLIQEKLQRLSPQKQAEVLGFIEFLLSKEKPRKPRKLTFSWADGPGDPPVNMTSVELQHEATRLRAEDEIAD